MPCHKRAHIMLATLTNKMQANLCRGNQGMHAVLSRADDRVWKGGQGLLTIGLPGWGTAALQ